MGIAALGPTAFVAGRFQIQELASSGGMGRVYRGLDVVRDVPVAIKLMHEQLSPVEVARFAREVEVLAQLDHPGIVAYVAHGHTWQRGFDYLVTHGQQCLSNGLIIAQKWQEAEEVAQAVLARDAISVGFQAMARHVVAQVRLALGDLPQAESEVRKAIELSPHTPIRRLQMVATLLTLLTQSARAAEACVLADDALTEMAGLDGGGYAELALLHAAADAFRQGGDVDRARALAHRAGQKLRTDAERFQESTARDRFLTAVPLHAAIGAAS